MVVPTVNKLPGAWLPVAVGVPQLSVTVGRVHVALAPQSELSATKVWLPGQFKVGAMLSTTVIRALQLEVLPLTSVTCNDPELLPMLVQL